MNDNGLLRITRTITVGSSALQIQNHSPSGRVEFSGLQIDRTILTSIACLAIMLTLSSHGVAAEPRKSGLNEVVVLDPGTHELGLPAVRMVPATDGQVTVEIPPTVHAHRFYYGGDKEFQGPIVQGGPTVVVANHPKTGEQMYVDVNLPPGAPVIAHRKSSITYIYLDRRVTIKFSRLKSSCVVVYQKSGQGVWRKSHDKLQSMKSATYSHFQNSQLYQAVKEGSTGGKHLVVGLVDSADQAGGSLLRLTHTAIGAIPGVSSLRSIGEERPQRQAFGEVNRKQVELRSAFSDTIPTIR